MAVEIEIKLKVDDFSPLRERLRSLGAMPLGSVLETNVFFDTPDGSLIAADRGLRIRRSHPLAGGNDQIRITYKGPRLPGKIKQREEIELAVNDLETAATFLQRLGYVRTLVFDKRRESWSFQSCTIELDELPQLGLFVEIESSDASAIEKTHVQLMLAESPIVVETYAHLVWRQIEKTSPHDRILKFE